MILETLFPIVGGGALGFAVGYALKKIAKFVMIGLGLVALLLGYLEYQKWILVNWHIIENQTSTIMTHVSHKAYLVTQHMGYEIPIGMGVIGFLPGMILGFTKG